MTAPRLRIALVTPWYGTFYGGVEVHVEQIAAHLVARGHHVEVLAQSREPAALDETDDGVVVRRFPVALPPPAYAIAPALGNFLARHARDYDVVHAHNYHTFPALQAALAGAGPLVFTPHYHGTGHRPLGRILHVPYRLLAGRIFDRSRVITCVSETEAASVRRHFPNIGGRVTVIPNGVDIHALQAAKVFPALRPVLLSVGRLADYKRVDQLLEVTALLDGIDLVVIGQGPARQSLEERAASLGLGSRARFLGHVDQGDLYRWYRTAAVCASLSTSEAFGMTLTEGLASGARVVASDIPAHREVLAGAGTRAALVSTVATAAEIAIVIGGMIVEHHDRFPAPGLTSWTDVVGQLETLYIDLQRGP